MLRDIILAGDLGPGERLLQEELAKRFDVSPTPIREAIKQLVAEGVLSHSPYKGVHVAEVNLEDAHEIYLIRAVVEELATKLAVPRLRIMDIKQLHAYHQTICDHLEAGERKAIRKVNYNFHILIYETANMPELLRIIRGLWMKSPLDSLYVIPRRAQQAIDEHQAILDAIDDGDADRAGAGMRIHIENGWKTLTTYLEENQ
ncbi:MAG: GntR family transcriptional regulator [Chloroflexi bacterium]|nr:MAG: GntR family transcriptional regulator [Chloroflexota bacterium]